MPFSTQFDLTLELTRLLPLNLLGNASQSAVLSLARQLCNSGSDIIIEQDLAELFGRSRVGRQLESSFRAIVSRGKNAALTDELSLISGPGPTVTRAFQDRSYFATIVQISLLTWVHDHNDLSQALVDVMEKKYEHAPPGYLSPPSRRGIYGTLTACQKQTSLFGWNHMLDAVKATIGQSQEASLGLQADILRGLLDMLPMVQTLPRKGYNIFLKSSFDAYRTKP